MRVLAFGTYDILHKGHIFFLEKAKQYGDELVVVLARDTTVLKIKGKGPRNGEQKRKLILEEQLPVDEVVLGSVDEDKYAIIEKIKPNIIVLGYDQTEYTKNLMDELCKRNLSCKIIRIEEAFEPQKYKSSKL